MATTFPGAIDTFTTKVDAVDYYLASHMNDVQNAVVAAQTAIGREGNSGLVEGRLTGTTGLPVTTADLTTITSVKYTPYIGNRIALHSGTGWVTNVFTELSLTVPNTTNTMYDVFCYLSGGTPTLEALAWSSDTARATALTTLDGVLVKTGAADRRYLGSFRTTGVSGNTADSAILRYLWNYYNRVNRTLTRLYSASHTYNVAVWRAFNNNAGAAMAQFVVGVAEDALLASTYATLTWAAGDSLAYLGCGLNTSAGPSTIAVLWATAGSAAVYSIGAVMPREGYNFLCPVEYATAGGTAPTFAECQVDTLVRS